MIFHLKFCMEVKSREKGGPKNKLNVEFPKLKAEYLWCMPPQKNYTCSRII